MTNKYKIGDDDGLRKYWTIHGTKLLTHNIAGETREMAFSNLKKNLEKWGPVD